MWLTMLRASASGRPFTWYRAKATRGLRAVHGDGFALAGDLGLIDFALTFGGEVSTGAHGKAEAIMPERPPRARTCCRRGGAGDARNDAEDSAQAVVDSVDGIADPRAWLLAALASLGQHLFQHRFGFDFGYAGRCCIVAAQERTQLA